MRRRSPDATQPLWRRLGSRDEAVAQAAMDELAAMTPDEAAVHIRWPIARSTKRPGRAYSLAWALGMALAAALFVLWHHSAGTVWEWALGVLQAAGAGVLGLLAAAVIFTACGIYRRYLTAEGRAISRWLDQEARNLAASPTSDLLDACRVSPMVSEPCRHRAEQALAFRLAQASERDVSALDVQHRHRLRMLLSTQASFLVRSRFEGIGGANGRPGDRHSVPLILAIVRAYETITDAEALKEVEKCIERAEELDRLGRSTDASRTVADACRALLPDLRARVEAQRRGETLLRPVSAGGDSLLRPAEAAADALLRPAEGEPQQSEQR